ncbi:MAG: hypothetical protein IM533_06630 [Pseudanabaena sp. M007S1SP1A06QC]|jgi:hypothetical protein|nr:hypothetical protein [Pseudanabaena sp. M007S1SP1A06QC]
MGIFPKNFRSQKSLRAIADWQKAAELYRQQGNLEASQDELKKIQSLQQI